MIGTDSVSAREKSWPRDLLERLARARVAELLDPQRSGMRAPAAAVAASTLFDVAVLAELEA